MGDQLYMFGKDSSFKGAKAPARDANKKNTNRLEALFRNKDNLGS